MSVFIRVDAGEAIGGGHLMRCLTLADALAAKGQPVTFLMGPPGRPWLDRVRARGHRVDLLPQTGTPAKPGGYADRAPAHAAWLATGWAADAAACAEVLRQAGGAELVILDHYGLDARWQAQVRPLARRLMVIDDLADRPHGADILLDYNVGRREPAYDGLVPDHCRRLMGPRYALIGPGFASQRPHALARRAEATPRRDLLLFLSSGSVGERVAEIARTLWACGAVRVGRLLAVRGRPDAPRPADLPAEIDWQPTVPDMAAALAGVDLAIGGGGVSALERCVLGLPCLLVVLADNQWIAARALDAGGAAQIITLADLSADRLRAFVDMEDKRYRAMSAAAAGLCDGAGAERVVQALAAPL